ncbi:MAG: DUF58 domain-containing protein [Myxococcota bacterium]
MNEAVPPVPRRRRRGLRRWLSARGRRLEITRSGWLFILLTLAVGFAAINSGANLLHAIFGAQMALILGSGVLSESTLRRVSVRRLLTGALHADEPGPMVVELRNTDPRRDVLAVSVEDDDDYENPGRCDPVFAVRVAAGQTLRLPTRLTMPTRGRHARPRAVVATRFPFGLFVKRRELPVDAPALVYPRRVPAVRSPLPVDRGGPPRTTGRRARSGETFGLRPYREGDELRHLHWPATARLGQPVVREFEAGGQARVRLQLTPGRAGVPAFEAKVEQVAAEAGLRLLRDQAELELYYGDRCAVSAGTGGTQRRRVLDFLAEVG